MTPYRTLEHITAGRGGRPCRHLGRLQSPCRDARDGERIGHDHGGRIGVGLHINVERSGRTHREGKGGEI